jgi:hypothetical protein
MFRAGPTRRLTMKTSLWFEASMLAFILIISLAGVAANETAERLHSAEAESVSHPPSQRVASGS